MIEFLQMVPLPIFLFILCMPGLFMVAPAISAYKEFKQSKAMKENPVTPIAESPEEYVSIEGIVTPLLTGPIHATFTGRECCWFLYKTQKYVNAKGDNEAYWKTVKEYSSSQPILLVDKSGACAILPFLAEVSPAHRNLWYGSNPKPEMDNRDPDDIGNEEPSVKQYRYIEERIHEGDHLYAMGTLIKKLILDEGYFDDEEAELDVDDEDEEKDKGPALPPGIVYLQKPFNKKERFIISSGSESDVMAQVSQQAMGALVVSLVSASVIVILIMIRYDAF